VTRAAIVSLAVIATALVAGPGTGAREFQEPVPAPLFRSVVDVVTVDAFVHHERRPLDGLTAADFIVRDNGVEQRVESIGTTDSAHVIIGLDLSGSVDGNVLARLRGGVRTVVAQLTPDDRLSLFTFADRIRVLSRAARTGPQLDAALEQVAASGSTTLHDAITIGSLLATVDERPAVFLLFTDGEDTASWSTVGRALDVLRHTDVVVFPVGAGLPDGVVTQTNSMYFEHPTYVAPTAGDALRLLQEVADVTGGEFLRVERDAEFADTFASILARYRQRYLLSFTPTNVPAGGWHRLDVRLRTRPGAVVAREGYMGRSQ
jgi:VWFA-related protein